MNLNRVVEHSMRSILRAFRYANASKMIMPNNVYKDCKDPLVFQKMKIF